MPAPQLARIAAALHTDRCICTVRYIIKKHNVPGVLKYFMDQHWIPITTGQALLTELLPRPAKRTPGPHSTVGQLLLDPAFSTHIQSRPLLDLYGNVVEFQAMEITEEFHDESASDDIDTTDNNSQ